MTLILQSALNSVVIGQVEASSVPAIGSSVTYAEVAYTVLRYVQPILVSGENTFLRVRVR